MPKDASPMEGAQPASPHHHAGTEGLRPPLPQPTLCHSSSVAILCIPLPTDPVPGNLHPSQDLSCLCHPHKQIFQQMLIQRISQQLHGLMVIKKDQN